MKVHKAFTSQYDIWQWLTKHCAEISSAKNAKTSRFGDLFEPKKSANPKPYDWKEYHAPRNNHVHAEDGCTEWYCDIDSDEKARRNKCKNESYARKASMLIGDPEYSFIWSEQSIEKPKIPTNREINGKKNNCEKCKNLTTNAQGHRVCDIQSFLNCLSPSRT